VTRVRMPRSPLSRPSARGTRRDAGAVPSARFAIATRVLAIALFTSAFALSSRAALAAPVVSSSSSSAPPLSPLPILPSVPLVRIEVSADRLLLIEDVALPRGDWRAGDLPFYVSFGAPGAPQAFDARLFAIPDGSLEPAAGDAGEPVPVRRAPRRPSSAYLLLGRPQMAGAVFEVREASFKRAASAGGMAILRVRTLLPLPLPDPSGARELVVRLGTVGGAPLTLGRIQVAADARLHVAHAEARLCGPEADPYPLAVALTPKPAAPTPPPAQGPLAPVLAVRHATDDLCVRFTSPAPPAGGALSASQ
jgi:hypothetical protein